MTLSIAGGLLGIILAFWGARALLAFLASTSQRPLGFTAGLDFRVLGFTAAVAILTGIAFGLAPAVRCMRVDLTPVLKEGAGKGSREGHGGRGWLNLGNSLVVAQVALTVVVLVGAGLLVKTLENLKSIDPGFSTNNVLNFDVDPTLTGYKGERLATFYRDLRDRFNAIPGVLSASYSEMSLLSGSLSTTGFHLPGTPPKKESDADYLPVGAEFFATMRIPLVGGQFSIQKNTFRRRKRGRIRNRSRRCRRSHRERIFRARVFSNCQPARAAIRGEWAGNYRRP